MTTDRPQGGSAAPGDRTAPGHRSAPGRRRSRSPGPSRALLGLVLGAVLVGTAACGDDDDPGDDGRTLVPASTAPSAAPSPGPVDPEVAAEVAGVELPPTATGASAVLRRSAAGIDSYLLVLTLPGQAELDAFCRTAGLNGSFPRAGAPSAEDVERFGAPADATGVRSCSGSRPDDPAVQREVLATTGDAGLEVRLLTFRVPR